MFQAEPSDSLTGFVKNSTSRKTALANGYLIYNEIHVTTERQSPLRINDIKIPLSGFKLITQKPQNLME